MLFDSLILSLIVSLIALVIFAQLISSIKRFVNLTAWNQMTHAALMKAAVSTGLLITLLMYLLSGLTVLQLVAITVGSITLVWTLLFVTTRRVIRFFFPEIVFRSWINFTIVTFGRRKIYDSGLLDDLVD